MPVLGTLLAEFEESKALCEMTQTEVWEGTRGAIQRALAERYRSSKEAGAAHDAVATAALHPLGSDVVKVCLPDGQQKPFPANCLSLMTVSGAKGSNVNFSQISALLGQQARLQLCSPCRLVLSPFMPLTPPRHWPTCVPNLPATPPDMVVWSCLVELVVNMDCRETCLCISACKVWLPWSPFKGESS